MTAVFQAGAFSLPLNRTYVMGILNVTPDSFSDGGKYLSLIHIYMLEYGIRGGVCHRVRPVGK